MKCVFCLRRRKRLTRSRLGPVCALCLPVSQARLTELAWAILFGEYTQRNKESDGTGNTTALD